MKHHTKDKGDLGVLKAQVDLAEQGFAIFIPLTEHAPFDLVAYRDKEFLRIQVKYRSIDKHGTISAQFRSTWNDRNGTHYKDIDKNEVDIFCIYCPETNECYYINPKEFNKSVQLRIMDTKNKQTSNIRFASSFRTI